MALPEMPKIDPREVEHKILTLAKIGAVGQTGVCRVAYSDEWREAQELVRAWADEAGLETKHDQVGNLWASSTGTGDAIVTGSHIDSQRSGGRYDGALGVLAGLIAISGLTRTFGQPKRPLQLVSFCEEEGSRFPTAGFWGSRALVGRTQEADCEAVRDANGIPIGAAMRALGYNPARINEVARTDIAGFIELHIEQGPILEEADLPVAIVDAITHIRQTEIVLEGTANHAGAFPMDIRSDPMAGFAEVAAAVIQHAEMLGRPAVTTVGRCEVDPNASAIVPKHVRFTIDARHPDPSTAAAMYAHHDKVIEGIAAKRGLSFERQILIDHPACPSDPVLLGALHESADLANVQTMRMASGAGHDAQQMSRICPVAMLFVRSKDGRSHTPEEFSAIPDIVRGIQVLTGALYRLAYT